MRGGSRTAATSKMERFVIIAAVLDPPLNMKFEHDGIETKMLGGKQNMLEKVLSANPWKIQST